MAPAGADRSAVPVRRAAADRFSPKFCGSLRGRQCGASSTPSPVHSVDGRDEREQIIEAGAVLALAGEPFMEITNRLVQETGCSPETVRYTLKRFDMKHPGMAIFPHRHRPLPTETKQWILQQHRLGVSAEALAQQFCQTRTGIYRIIKELLAARIVELPLNSMGNEYFAQPALGEEATRDIGADAGI